uniref:Deltamethrin resistance protein prag01 domain-containing protein n=1 Tax=Trichuris muris TaxID=70415 RepID=A0A5S6QF24_TRIMR
MRRRARNNGKQIYKLRIPGRVALLYGLLAYAKAMAVQIQGGYRGGRTCGAGTTSSDGTYLGLDMRLALSIAGKCQLAWSSRLNSYSLHSTSSLGDVGKEYCQPDNKMPHEHMRKQAVAEPQKKNARPQAWKNYDPQDFFHTSEFHAKAEEDFNLLESAPRSHDLHETCKAIHRKWLAVAAALITAAGLTLGCILHYLYTSDPFAYDFYSPSDWIAVEQS